MLMARVVKALHKEIHNKGAIFDQRFTLKQRLKNFGEHGHKALGK